jgi:hypothetical protein
MSQLVIKSTERKAPAPQIDRSGDHLWGDVIDILSDDFPVDHLIPEPFVVIKVAGEKADLIYLLEPLDAIHRKRYGLRLEDMPSQNFSELCAIGKTALSVPILESIIENRGS